jgi:hypothetical protein
MPSKSFDNADEVRTPDKTRVEVVKLGAMQVSRFTMQPGWRWSECIKPIAGTDTCQVHHLDVAVSGSLHVVEADGTEMDVVPGAAYEIAPGHDAWVSGDEAFVGYEFDPNAVATFAKG